MPTLAERIRQKYPGSYDGIPDAELEKLVVAKYPQYASLVEPEPAAPAEEKSVGGFLGNVAASGGRFLQDTAQGALALGKMAVTGSQLQTNPMKVLPGIVAGTRQALDQAPQMLGAIKNAVMQRYGSPSAIGHTLYTDPVGVLADVSSLAGGVGLAGKIGGAGKLAKAAGAVEGATNPMRAVGAVAEPVLHGAGNLVVRGTLRAPKAVRDDFGGGRGVADAVLRERVYSDASASRKLKQSTAQADQMLADAQAAGTPGVRRGALVQAVMDEPQDTAKLRARLGVPDATPELRQTARGITKNNPREIPLTDAQAMKREAQTLAYEAGVDNNTVKKAAEKAKAQALRAGIEQQVPDVGPVNERSQRLLGAQRAFAEAEDRQRAMTNFLSVLGGSGVGAASGDLTTGLLVAALMKGMDSPRAGAIGGIALDSLGHGLNAEGVRRAALIARLSGTPE